MYTDSRPTIKWNSYPSIVSRVIAICEIILELRSISACNIL